MSVNHRSLLIAISALLLSSALLQADESSLDRAKQRLLADDFYKLQYKYATGESLRYKVEHLATVETRIQATTQTTESRAVSTKLWKVLEAKKDRIRFEHSIEDAQMWQQVSGRQAEQFDSRKDEEPPEIYKAVAGTVGKPLSVITMDTAGNVVTREDSVGQFNLGSGGLTMPLPKEAVPLGHRWSVPYDVRVRKQDKTFMKISTRKLYTLEKVQTGIATISVKTQVLTPVNDAQIKSQLVQRLANGEIKFDIKRGRMLSKTMEWDENVVSFHGPQSNMKYVARFTETLIDAQQVAAKAGTKQAK